MDPEVRVAEPAVTEKLPDETVIVPVGANEPPETEISPDVAVVEPEGEKEPAETVRADAAVVEPDPE